MAIRPAPASPRLRGYDPHDRDACARIFVAAQRVAFPWEPADAVRLSDFDRAIEGERLWVAELPAPASSLTPWAIAGFVAVFMPDRFVHSLFVEPVFHGRGVGSALLEQALRATAGSASLKCDERNRKACFFYERRGWRACEWGWAPSGPWIRFSR
ncbi:acetyltransferase [Hypericibacter adhaerens]|jgi:GNAT superfamily N-acetyltransferase|uniref:Acetyltransferase n=1 Tax=Hypericibacter adhaerens TaxID=2602016 RepID=A0A5J6MZ17_9PROT|nr:GNAT family N-acetyltransferase [Hypericibacter adhaerens]QEX22377.1 acetyltransferase [Hypericibacter adhaerens]